MAGNYFFGQGKVYVGLRNAQGTPQGFSFLGNCPELTLQLGRNASRFAKGGTETQSALVPRGEGSSVRLMLDEFNLDHIAMVLYGRNSQLSAAVITDEPIVAYLGKTVPLQHLNLTTNGPAVTHVSGTPTYTEGVDYTVDREHGSLTFPLTGSAITEGQALAVDYQYSTYDKISGLTMAPGFWWLRMEGYNITRAPYTPIVLDVYKVRIKPVSLYPIITDDLSVLEIEATMHYDNAQADNTSDGRFFRIRRYTPT